MTSTTPSTAPARRSQRVHEARTASNRLRVANGFREYEPWPGFVEQFWPPDSPYITPRLYVAALPPVSPVSAALRRSTIFRNKGGRPTRPRGPSVICRSSSDPFLQHFAIAPAIGIMARRRVLVSAARFSMNASRLLAVTISSVFIGSRERAPLQWHLMYSADERTILPASALKDALYSSPSTTTTGNPTNPNSRSPSG